MKLVLAAALAGLVFAADKKYDVSVACDDDSAVTITIPYDREAKLIKFKAGSCNETHGVKYDQDSNHAVTISVDMRACGMRNDATVRSIIFANTAEVTLGRKPTDQVNVVTYTSSIKLECGVEDDYVVSIDYGQINADYSGKTGFQGGEKEYKFQIESFNKNFTDLKKPSNRAGDAVYLGISSIDVPFGFYKFAVSQCTFSEMEGTTFVTNYTLFDNAANNCSNSFLDFSMGYNTEKNRYEFSHTVFTFDPTRPNNYTLSCKVKLCDFGVKASVNQCNVIEKNCGIDAIGMSGNECFNKKSDPKGEMYTGKLTDSACITWFENKEGDEYKPTDGLSHTDKSSSHAYCRNPDAGVKPWCYIKPMGGKHWRYCAPLNEC